MSSSGDDTSGSDAVSLGIIGGSGMCEFQELKVIRKIRPNTRYGLPSDDILICEHHGQQVAFLPRHGAKHAIAPHKVPYKANLAALKALGVRHIVATCICGSLKQEIPPGSFVLPDQFCNMTWGRDDYTDADDGAFIHLPMADPYCPRVGQSVLESAARQGIVMISQGIVAVIQGPRFTTRAESRVLSSQGFHIVNMTQYPECYLARELGMCYAVIASVTDYDVGLGTTLSMDPANENVVLPIFWENIRKTKQILLDFVEHHAGQNDCACAADLVRPYYQHHEEK